MPSLVSRALYISSKLRKRADQFDFLVKNRLLDTCQELELFGHGHGVRVEDRRRLETELPVPEMQDPQNRQDR